MLPNTPQSVCGQTRPPPNQPHFGRAETAVGTVTGGLVRTFLGAFEVFRGCICGSRSRSFRGRFGGSTGRSFRRATGVDSKRVDTGAVAIRPL
jgi:hypothetical protein